MALGVEICTVGMMQTNCYIIYKKDDKAQENALQAGEAGERGCILVDPGAQPEKIEACCQKHGAKPVAILLTHGHFDHTMAVEPILKKYGKMPVYALKEELPLLEEPKLNLSERFTTQVRLTGDVVTPVEDGQKLSLLGHTFTVIATPGHTGGGCCYYAADSGLLFAGDTLFRESYGRTDFPTGSMREIVKSIGGRLLPLPEETKVYPGHEAPTTIAHERKYNICAVIYQKALEQNKL